MLNEEIYRGAHAAVTAYEPGRLEINGRVYTEAVVLQEAHVGRPGKTLPQELTVEDFLQTASEGGALPEVVLVGTGGRQVFLHPRVAAALAAEGVGLECMPTASACRTLMILQSEGRRVWAWLWP